jgi:hypothetical protein
VGRGLGEASTRPRELIGRWLRRIRDVMGERRRYLEIQA